MSVKRKNSAGGEDGDVKPAKNMKVKKKAPKAEKAPPKAKPSPKGKGKGKGKGTAKPEKENKTPAAKGKGKGKKELAVAAKGKGKPEKADKMGGPPDAKKKKKGGGGDSKEKTTAHKDRKKFMKKDGGAGESGESAKSRNQEYKKLKKQRQKEKRSEDVYELGVEAKKAWERVRREDCPEEEKNELIAKLAEDVKGRVKKLVFAHDTVRVIECLIAIGGEGVRGALFDEMIGDVIELAKGKYSTFIVAKMVKYGSKEQKEKLFKAFEGRVADLMRHKAANTVVENFYNDVANAKQRNAMLQEFCGPEFRHFKEPELRTVKQLVEKFPEKAKSIVYHLGENVGILVTKGCYNHSFVHTVIYNYMEVCSADARRELIEQLRDVCVHVLHSHDGARLSMLAVWHGTPKDRKAIIKSFKTFVPKISQEQYGHMVLMAIFDAVDDTKLVSKAIIGEITENIADIAASPVGSKVLMYLVDARNSKYFYPGTLDILKQGDGNEHSKKDAAVRRDELKSTIAGPLVKQVALIMSDLLLSDNKASIFFTCVLNAVSAEVAKPALEVLAEEAAKPFDDENNVIENAACHSMFKKVIDCDASRGEPRFSDLVLDTLEDEGTECWLRANRGCFLFVHMLNLNNDAITEKVKSKVMRLKKTLKQQKSKGAELLREKLGL